MSIKDKVKKAARSVWSWLVAAALAVAAFFGYEADTAEPTYAVTLTMPTQYTSGEPLALTELASYTIVYTVNGGAQQTKVVTSGITAISSTTIPKQLGRTCASAFVTTNATGLTPNTSSSQVGPVCVVNAGIPNAPTNLTLQ